MQDASFTKPGSDAAPFATELPREKTGLMPRQTIAEIVRCRNEALDLYRAAYDSIVEADDLVKSAHAMADRARGLHRSEGRFTYHLRDAYNDFVKAVQLPDRTFYLEMAKRLTDTNCWAHIIEATGIEMLMDKQAREELHQQMMMQEPPRPGHAVATGKEKRQGQGMPDITEENIIATLQQFRGDADLIFRRGVANAFAQLDRRFRSHDGFKIGSRIIFSYAFGVGGSWSFHRDHEASIIDIERAFKILDGQKASALRYGSIVDRISNERQGLGYGPKQSEHLGDFFKIRIFKNGNAHIWFTRDDLVVKVNKLLADYYGEVIGDGKTEGHEDDPLKAPKTTIAKRYGFYPSPQPVVEQLLNPEHRWQFGKGPYLTQPATKPPLTVLEPSAGTGSIARRCIRTFKQACEEWAGDHERYRKEYRFDNQVDVVEIQRDLAEALARECIYRKVYCMDFLALKPSSTGLYDYVVMNPPFDRERDIDHVMHALDFLKPDGALHAVMSAGTEFRETRKSIAFRSLMDKLNASWCDLPQGAFAESGTYINTCIVRVRKDGV